MRRVLLGLALAVFVPAVPAHADDLVVRNGRARAVIHRAPFSLAFTDGARTVLAEVGAADRGPAAVPPAVRPQPENAHLAQTPPLYAPLAFVVGARRQEEWPGGLYQGNVLAGAQGGVEYA